MPFDHILGQETAVGTLKRVLTSGRVHHALRFEGPQGVGKEMAAMAFAQALVCEKQEPFGCGTCSACRRAVQLCEGPPAVPLHPDVIFVERGLYPPELIERSREAQEISVHQIRAVILSRGAFGPHEGRARVFIIRRAEELSISAANALLKILEEPGPGTYFVLLVSRPARLLGTILSRTLRVRFAALPESVVAGILINRGIADVRAHELAALSGGSATAALALADEDASAERDAFVKDALAAIQSTDLVSSLALAESRAKDKGKLRMMLEALALRMARAARSAALRDDERALGWSLRYQIVLQAMRELDRNASPALLIENMMLRLRAEAG